MTEKKLPDGITQEMIDSAKQKHGESNVKFMDLPIDDEGSDFKTVLVVVPSRTILGEYRRLAESDPKRADEVIVKNCLVSHKDEVLANDGLFYGAVNGIASLIPIRKGIIKNC